MHWIVYPIQIPEIAVHFCAFISRCVCLPLGRQSMFGVTRGVQHLIPIGMNTLDAHVWILIAELNQMSNELERVVIEINQQKIMVIGLLTVCIHLAENATRVGWARCAHELRRAIQQNRQMHMETRACV